MLMKRLRVHSQIYKFKFFDSEQFNNVRIKIHQRNEIHPRKLSAIETDAFKKTFTKKFTES